MLLANTSLLLGIVVVLGVCFSQVSSIGSKVEYLPGYQGPLPFELETGYIGVGESEDVQLFYYFVKSESNPSVDPLVLWISGGPGCSSFFALNIEFGPLLFNIPKNNWTIPTFSLNPYSWTKVASFIFLDLPVGTGFSYAKSSKNYTSNSIEAGDHAAEFVRKWFVDHSEYHSNSLYVGGDSYSGITVPIIVQAISHGVDERLKPHINLKGYLIGNGKTFPTDFGYALPSARGFSIISDELYKSILEECGGISLEEISNLTCSLYHAKFFTFTLVISPGIVLDTNCATHIENQSLVAKRFRGINARGLDTYRGCKCHDIANQWANDYSAQEAIHVKKGSIEKWVQCSGDNLHFEKIVHDTIPYHANLSTKGYRSLIYSGSHDLLVSSLSTQEWTKSLNYSTIDDWRPWFVNKQIVGYTTTYYNNMTYAKLKGAGHVAPTNMPLECFAMFKRWISYEKL